MNNPDTPPKPTDAEQTAGKVLDGTTCSPLVVPTGRRFKAKSPCPYCGGEITCSANAWEQEEDGSWIATDLDLECSNEPPIDSKKWAEWDREHGRGDWNHAWHDLHDALIRGLKRRFRFNMENSELR
jgi:hypothetical protein